MHVLHKFRNATQPFIVTSDKSKSKTLQFRYNIDLHEQNAFSEFWSGVLSVKEQRF